MWGWDGEIFCSVSINVSFNFEGFPFFPLQQTPPSLVWQQKLCCTLLLHCRSAFAAATANLDWQWNAEILWRSSSTSKEEQISPKASGHTKPFVEFTELHCFDSSQSKWCKYGIWMSPSNRGGSLSVFALMWWISTWSELASRRQRGSGRHSPPSQWRSGI